ncbi:unnamed protein product [Closterium sp. NIES-53]
MSASQLVNLLGTPHAMYAVVDSSASDSVYSSVVSSSASLAEVPVASVGTCVDTSPRAAPEDASLSFTLNSGASHCLFRDRTTLTPLPTPVSVALADPTSGPITARYTTTLPCPAAPSSSLTDFHVPSFSRNLVGVRPLMIQHVCVWIEPSGETAVAASPQVAVSSQVPVFGLVVASCSCRSLAHPTVLWHHKMGHLSISHMRAMSSQRLVLGLLRVLPSLLPSLVPPCGPCFEGRLRATPHSSLRPATEPFETLHLDFDVTSMLIRWLLTTSDTRGRRVRCLHSDRGESPEQNGVAERRIGLVMEIARTSMTHARAPHFLWPYAVRYAAHQLNLWPRVSWPEVSLTSLWTGSPGVASRFRVWGCLALVRDTSADKISPRVVPCVFLGFLEDSSNYTFYHPPLHQFFDSRDVRFDESVPYYARYPCRGLPVPPPLLFLTSRCPLLFSRLAFVLPCFVLVCLVLTEFASTGLDYATSLVAAPPTSPLAVGGESALGCDALEDRQFELEFLAAASPHLCAMLLAPEGGPDALDIPTPRTYVEVPPLGANIVDGMWIFRVKRPPGSPPVFKARYVARGFSQREGFDFFHTFAPTPKMTTLRVLLHVAAQRDYELHSPDFSTAFLQGSLHEEVWLRLPPAFTGTFPPGTQVALADMKLELQKRHICTDLGELRHYLGLQITRDKAARTIILSQSHMVQQVLQRFELQHSTVQHTPLAVDHRLTGPFLGEPFEPSGPYAELVGCLMYLMTCTRPDLAFPLSILARFVAPGRHRPVHWTAAVRVAKYLTTTSGVELVLGGRQDVVLTGHCDYSYADDAETHRSTQGYCFSLGSGAVSWRSTCSSSVSTYTVEAEIYAGAMAAQELRWLTFLLTDLGERPSSAPTLFTDNKATILLCGEPRMESRVKHINVRFFLMRELQRRGQARFNFVESEANTADIFTKALSPCDHQRCCVQLDLVETGSRLA